MRIVKLYKTSAIILISAAFFIPATASAAVFYITSEKNNFNVGDAFAANVRIDSEGTGVNAAQATIQYSKDALEIVNTDKTNSVFEFWLREPEFSNDTGRLVFVGGTTSGFSGKMLQVLKINFRVKGGGSADITLNDAAVTASDGSGTNVLSTLRGLQITAAPKTEILPQPSVPAPIQITRPAVPIATLPVKPAIKVPLYPDQNRWYNIPAQFFANWQLPADAIGVATAINKNPSFIPEKSEGLFGTKQFSLLDDGIWYLHVRFKNNIGWGPVAHYKISIDTTPPSSFKIQIDNPVSDNPSPIIKYMILDSLSGISEIRIFVDNKDPLTSTSTDSFKLHSQGPGKHIISVRALDRAGNSTEQSVNFEILPIKTPVINSINKKVIVGTDDNLLIQGSAMPDINVIVAIEDKNKFLIVRDNVKTDSAGKWDFRLDKELRRGDYFVSATAQDLRGALSFPTEQIKVSFKDKPIISLFGLDITLRELAIILLVAFVLAVLYFYRKTLLHLARSQRESMIINRDIRNAFDLIKKDLSKISDIVKKGAEDNSKLVELSAISKKIGDTLDRIEKYSSRDIERLK